MKEAPSLSQILLNQLNQKTEDLNLTEMGPVLSFLPPFLLQEMPPFTKEAQYSFQPYKTAAELLKEFPSAQIRRGHPKEIHRFLSGNEDVFLDFDQLGVVCLSRKTATSVPTNSQMARWLDYALSPELWGPEGKWTRFHEQLHKLFEKHNLLERNSVPGYYPLKSNARVWEKYPLKGDLSEQSFALVLPWTFSLTDLRKLESFFS
jgi:hypothetical protein